MTGGIHHEEIFQRERRDCGIQHRTFQRVAGCRLDILLRTRPNHLKVLQAQKSELGGIDDEKNLQRQCFGSEHGTFRLFIGSRSGTGLRNG